MKWSGQLETKNGRSKMYPSGCVCGLRYRGAFTGQHCCSVGLVSGCTLQIQGRLRGCGGAKVVVAVVGMFLSLVSGCMVCAMPTACWVTRTSFYNRGVTLFSKTNNKQPQRLPPPQSPTHWFHRSTAVYIMDVGRATGAAKRRRTADRRD